MLVRTTTPIFDYDGAPVKSRSLPNGAPDPMSPQATVRDLIYRALNNYKAGEEPTSEDSARRYRITNAFFSSATIEDLTIEDAAFIKECAGKTLNPLGYGRVCDALENAAQGPALTADASSAALASAE